jgi:MYXO-CTERM domain-containing protein
VRRARAAGLGGATLVAALAVSTVAFDVSASPHFPTVLQRELGSECAPACTLCHWTEAGGSGKVTRTFGLAMMEAGLQPHDDKALSAALAQLEVDGTDSDGDGMGDVKQLRSGLNPNDGTPLCHGPVTCAVSAWHQGSRPPSTAAGLLAALVAVLLWRRRS